VGLLTVPSVLSEGIHLCARDDRRFGRWCRRVSQFFVGLHSRISAARPINGVTTPYQARNIGDHKALFFALQAKPDFGRVARSLFPFNPFKN
jgi:hypothetical protein